MSLYLLLSVFFTIGFVGIYTVNKKETDAVKKKNNWTKYAVYLALVFGQLFLINSKIYFYFALILVLISFYELLKIGKSKKETAIGVLFIALFGLFFILFFKDTDSKWQQFVFIIVITFDGYSQIAGQLFGKTKLFPKTSPNKTLEGLLGGTLSVLITALILSNFLQINCLQAIAIGFVIIVLAVFGDFVASYYKRLNQAKDFSQIIPAHGGVLDRFDSLIMASFGLFFVLKLNFSDVFKINTLLYFGVFSFVFLLAEVLYHSFKSKVEISRKFVHIGSGLISLSFPFYINNHWVVLLLCSNFILILMLSKRFGFLQSINKIDRKSFGSMLFPVSVYLSFLCFNYFDHQYLFFYLPILILAICDPIATLVGQKWAFGKYKIGNDTKTIVGSISFMVSCFLILTLSLWLSEVPISMAMLLIYSFCIAITTTFAEAFSKNGIDNLTIPFSVIVCLILIL
jgi:CDP-diglyceride synthetase